MQNYDERFQERIDEMALIEEKIRSLTAIWQEETPEMLKNIGAVNDSLRKINAASESIATYMQQCEHHAQYTRNVFMGAVAGCALVISGMLWWAHDINNDLDSSQKELESLQELFKGMPEFQKVDGHNYVHIVKGTETNAIKNDDGQTIHGRYAKVWYVQ